MKKLNNTSEEGKTPVVEAVAKTAGTTAAADSMATIMGGICDRPNTRILCAEDLTFHIPIVYAYCSGETFLDLAKILFSDPHDIDISQKGLSGLAKGAKALGHLTTCLVWVNNEDPLMITLPCIVHLIVHASQKILRHAGVEDSSGEVQAYLVERETTRVLRELYGMELPPRSVVGKLKEVLAGGGKAD